MGTTFRSKEARSSSTQYPISQPAVSMAEDQFRRLFGYTPTQVPDYSRSFYWEMSPEQRAQSGMGMPMRTEWTQSGRDPLSEMFAEAIGGGRAAMRSAEDLLFGPGGQRQYSLAAQRMLGELRPGLAARGVLTSGPGIDIEAEKLGNLAVEQQVAGTQLMQQASQGLALLQAMPEEIRARLLQMIMQQATGGVSQSYGGQGSVFSEILNPISNFISSYYGSGGANS